MIPQAAVATRAMKIRLVFAGVAVIAAFFPVRQSVGACMTGDEYLIYQGQLEKTKADFASQCANPSESDLLATESCKPESPSGELCKPFCSEGDLAKGTIGSGVQWLHYKLPDQKICTLPKRANVLRAIPGGGNSEYASMVEYRSLKIRWLQDYQKNQGVRTMLAAYRKAVLEVMKDPGMVGLMEADKRPVSALVTEVYTSLDDVTKSVQALERPSTLNSDRARIAQEAFALLQGGCKTENAELTGKCPGGETRRYSADHLIAYLLDFGMERASEKYPELSRRIEKVRATYSSFYRGLNEMNERMGELRLVANCRDLRSSLRELSTRYSAACLAEAKCNPPPVLPLSLEWVRSAYAPVRSLVQTDEVAVPAQVIRIAPAAKPPSAPKAAAAKEEPKSWNFPHLEDTINRLELRIPEPRMRDL